VSLRHLCPSLVCLLSLLACDQPPPATSGPDAGSSAHDAASDEPSEAGLPAADAEHRAPDAGVPLPEASIDRPDADQGVRSLLPCDDLPSTLPQGPSGMAVIAGDSDTVATRIDSTSPPPRMDRVSVWSRRMARPPSTLDVSNEVGAMAFGPERVLVLLLGPLEGPHFLEVRRPPEYALDHRLDLSTTLQYGLAVSPDGALFLTGNFSQTELRRLVDGHLVATLPDRPDQAVFAPDSARVATIGNYVLHLWQLPAGKPLALPAAFPAMGPEAGLFQATYVSFTADLAIGGGQLRRLSDGSLLAPLPSTGGGTWHRLMTVSTSGRFMLWTVTGSEFFLETKRLVDRRTQAVYSVPGQSQGLEVISPDETWLLSDSGQPLCLPK
jgi:hypothetical protein